MKYDDEFYIVVGEEPYEVNETSARIFDLCNGRDSLDDMCRKMLTIFDYEEASMRGDIVTLLDELKSIGAIAEV